MIRFALLSLVLLLAGHAAQALPIPPTGIIVSSGGAAVTAAFTPGGGDQLVLPTQRLRLGDLTILLSGVAATDPDSSFAVSVTNTGTVPEPFHVAFSVPFVPVLAGPLEIDGSLGITITRANKGGAEAALDPASPAPGFMGFFGLDGAIQPCANVGDHALVLPVGTQTKTFTADEKICDVAAAGPFSLFNLGFNFIASPGGSFGVTEGVTISTLAVAEPGIVTLFGVGLLGIAGMIHRRARLLARVTP